MPPPRVFWFCGMIARVARGRRVCRVPNINETRDALSRFWLRARRKSCGLVILSKGLSTTRRRDSLAAGPLAGTMPKPRIVSAPPVPRLRPNNKILSPRAGGYRPKLVPARRVAARIGASGVARLGNRMTIAFTGALPSPILAATHTCFIMLGTLIMLRKNNAARLSCKTTPSYPPL